MGIQEKSNSERGISSGMKQCVLGLVKEEGYCALSKASQRVKRAEQVTGHVGSLRPWLAL